MSETITASDNSGSRRQLYIYVAWGTGIFVVLFAVVVLLVYLILRPCRPSFILQDMTVYNFNASTAPPFALTTKMQVTLSSTNPNSRVGIAYQSGMDIYAVYRDQQITLASLLPGTYQGHKEPVVWSPLLNGDSVPISPLSGEAFAQDLNAGTVMIKIKLDGKVRWKVGTWISGNYHLNVLCTGNIRFGDMIIKGQPTEPCIVEIGL